MSRFYNFIGAIPLIVWFSWDLWRDAASVIRNYHTLASSAHVYTLFAFQVLGQSVGIAYTFFVIILLVVRDTPRAQIYGFVPYAAATIGTFATTCLFVLPTAYLPIPVLALSTLCIVVGLGLSIYTLIYLGSSFAILPSARVLVMDGPYRLVRHPLYLFEEIAIVGLMLQFAQPWAGLIMAIQLAAQLVRMTYEERVLTKTFPLYAAYAAKTARLIPGLY